MSSLDPIPYSDAQIHSILERVRTIAMVGASSTGGPRSSHVMPEAANFLGVFCHCLPIRTLLCRVIPLSLVATQ
jgi:hypothetical protein